jgi:adenylate kinase family enzyme
LFILITYQYNRPPGVGKGTQCDLLIKKYKFVHFSAGDLLRAKAKEDSDEGRKVKSILDQGSIVPVKITCGLIKDAMDKEGKDKVFLIDGYPRNQDNIDGWKAVFGDSFELIASIILDGDDEVLIQRLVERGKTSGRSDDNIEVIRKRFKTHHSQSDPIVPELKTMGPFIQVNAIKTVDEVFNDITKELEPKLK